MFAADSVAGGSFGYSGLEVAPPAGLELGGHRKVFAADSVAGGSFGFSGLEVAPPAGLEPATS